MQPVLVGVLSALLLALAAAQTPNGVCPKYEKEQKNSLGITKCIPNAGSCLGTPDFVARPFLTAPCLKLPTDECPTARDADNEQTLA
ncbi:hypothetical protein M3Y99_01195800 [Aphelenchoides fujianensis]|nr:hypothetical protein M3Y99_01195800 [Aphelenchoides fujianensis]